MRVIYLGPSNRLRPGGHNEFVERGEEFDLSEESIRQLRTLGHQFESADKRRSLPEPEVTNTSPESEAET